MDIVGATLARLYRLGIVVVCSAGNGGLVSALNAETPRMHGGATTPLIVVGATEANESRWWRSQVLDPGGAGILSIYANGVNVVSASWRDDDLYSLGTGTSEATALTSGFVAYLLANDVLQARFAANGLPNVAAEVKNYILALATDMKGTARTDPNTNTPDPVPRLSNGEFMECPAASGVVNVPAYQIPMQDQEILPGTYPSIQVTDGTDIVLPNGNLVSYTHSSVNVRHETHFLIYS